MAEDARLINGPVFSGMLRFGIPLALAMAFHGLFNCIDLLIVGRLGPGAVAAVTMGGIINMVAMLAFNGVANVIAGRCSNAAGTGDSDRLAELVTAGRKLTLWLSVFFGCLFAALAVPLTNSFGVDAKTQTDGVSYLVILSLGSGTMFYLLFQGACLRAIGDSRRPMFALIGANVLNLLLDVLLVFGLWGFPQLGVAGAAWATVLSRLICAAYLGRILRLRESNWPKVIPRVSRVLSILKEGLTHSAQMVVRVISIYGLMIIAARATTGGEGVETTAMLDGIGVGIRLEMVVLFCALGWGTAAASFLGQNFGANRFDRAAYAMWVAVGGALVTCLLLGSILFIWPGELLHFVAPKAMGQALEQGSRYLRLVLIGHPGLIVAIVLSQALVGIGSVKTAVFLDFTLYVVLGLPLAFWLSQSANDTDLVWICVQWTHLLSGLAYLFFFRKRFLKEKQKDEATTAIVS
ncbi:MAG: putative MATE family efflux protein [Planctomycetota bacterium]|jgi:putative MATE family efflux protein